MRAPLSERLKKAIAAAVLTTAGAAGGALLLAPEGTSPGLTLFLVAMGVSAWYGGWYGGLLSIALTGLHALWLLPMETPAEHLIATRRILNFDILSLLVCGIVVAVREKKRAQKQLKSTEAHSELLFNESPLPMWVSSKATQKFLDVNAATTAQYGYARDEFLRMTVRELQFAEESGTPEEKTATPGAEFAGVLHHRKKDGTRIDVEITSRPIVWHDQPAVLAVARDVTEKRRLEEHLRQAQKMDAIGQLAGGIAHDFNNLLGVVIGYSELLMEQFEPGDGKREKIEQIKKAGDHGAALTRQLLAFSRKQMLEPKVLNLHRLMADLSKMLQRLIREDIRLVIGGGEDLRMVKVDPGQMEQVIINLVLNARDAMPNGGQLSIRTENADLDEAYVRMHAEVTPGQYVALTVSDTGMGMDAATRNRVFEPFFTTKEKGTGLGLATVYGIVKQSGGHIWVYSEPGRGSTFKVYLPMVSEPAAAGRYAAPALPPKGSETILLVEDAEGLRGFVRELLEGRGYRVLEAENGRQAIAAASAHAGDIHLLLTDVVLPEAGGREVARQVLELHPEARVLFMSGYTDDAMMQQGVLSSEELFLQKPFTAYALASKVREALGPPAPAD